MGRHSISPNSPSMCILRSQWSQHTQAEFYFARLLPGRALRSSSLPNIHNVSGSNPIAEVPKRETYGKAFFPRYPLTSRKHCSHLYHVSCVQCSAVSDGCGCRWAHCIVTSPCHPCRSLSFCYCCFFLSFSLFLLCIIFYLWSFDCRQSGDGSLSVVVVVIFLSSRSWE